MFHRPKGVHREVRRTCFLRQAHEGVRAGVLMKIADATGVPGKPGCIAWTRDSRRVLLTTWHALFSCGASWSAPIWSVAGTAADRRHSRIGRTLDRKIGTVRFHGDGYSVAIQSGRVGATGTSARL